MNRDIIRFLIHIAGYYAEINSFSVHSNMAWLICIHNNVVFYYLGGVHNLDTICIRENVIICGLGQGYLGLLSIALIICRILSRSDISKSISLVYAQLSVAMR